MKITDIKTFLVGAGGRNWIYVKILTDQGIYGIGEAYSAGPDEATVKVIEDFKSWLIGNDPRNVGDFPQDVRVVSTDVIDRGLQPENPVGDLIHYGNAAVASNRQQPVLEIPDEVPVETLSRGARVLRCRPFTRSRGRH